MTKTATPSKTKLEKEILPSLGIAASVSYETYGRKTVAYVYPKSMSIEYVKELLAAAGLRVQENYHHAAAVRVSYHKAFGWDK